MAETPDLVKSVVEDLRFLNDEWDQDVKTESLRRSSTVLRRLLVQGDLQRAWKQAGFDREPRIVAATLRDMLDVIPHPRILFACAGGAIYKGLEVRNPFGIVEMTDDEQERLKARGVVDEELGLHDFLRSPCVIVEGELVSRHRLIKYVANTQGGAHFDLSRPDDEEGRLFRKLDMVPRVFYVHDQNSVYFELLSVGQALVRAEGIHRLCERINSA